MPWIQVKLQTTGNGSAHVEDLLMGLGAVSVTLEDSADQPLLEPPPGATPIWDDTIITGLFEANANIDLITLALHNDLGDNTPIKVEALEDKDWIREWMDTFKPIPFGQRLWVCPSWHKPVDANAVNLMLDPGLAFGTGTHETTSLCLKWLDGADIQDKIVIDYGCGSGILAIAAALLGASRVVCVDNDPQALLATRQNAERNQIQDKIEVYTPESVPSLEADIMLANILAGPLVSLSARLSGFTKPGGNIVLSGILKEQAQEVSDAYANGFQMLPAVIDGDWVRLTGTKHPSS